MKGTVAPEIVEAGFESGDFSENETGWPEPSAFIQWKGTEVCMDFHCDCGAFCHYDGDFAYVVKCPHCSALWEMPSTVYPRKVSEENVTSRGHIPKILEPDEEKEIV